MSLTILSYGGGVQSTAMLVLAAQGRLGYEIDAAVFANVGDNSEHPKTLAYVSEVAEPFAKAHGIDLVTIRRVKIRSGQVMDLHDEVIDPENRGIKIPVRMDKTGAPGNRSCTSDYKIQPINRWLRQRGASKNNPATVCIGISTDEIFRMGRRKPVPNQEAVYPLIDLGISRSQCQSIISEAGIPVPPKSSCFFCPFHTKQSWSEMRRDEPELFQKSVDLERKINEKRQVLGRDPVWLSDFQAPLDQAVPVAQDSLPFESDIDGECGSGYCWT